MYQDIFEPIRVTAMHTFLLAGLALGLRKALLDEITITQGVRYEAYAEAWFDMTIIVD